MQIKDCHSFEPCKKSTERTLNSHECSFNSHKDLQKIHKCEIENQNIALTLKVKEKVLKVVRNGTLWLRKK